MGVPIGTTRSRLITSATFGTSRPYFPKVFVYLSGESGQPRFLKERKLFDNGVLCPALKSSRRKSGTACYAGRRTALSPLWLIRARERKNGLLIHATARRIACKTVKRSIASRFVLDIAFLLLVVALECLSFTGLTVHEWLGFVLCPVGLLHVVVQWDWFAAQFRTILSRGPARVWINCLLNVSLFLVVAATTISGVLISHQVVPVVGERLGRVYVWLWVHGYLNKPLLIFVGLHLASNWKWVVAAFSVNPPQASVRRHGAHIAVRSLSMSAIACALAFLAYLLFMFDARPPQQYQWDASVFQRLGVSVSERAPDRLPLRDGRPFFPRRGWGELMLVVILVFVSALAGRILLRSRV